MKPQIAILYICTALMLISCSNQMDSNQSEGDKLLAAFIEKQKQIDTIQYRVKRIDTLITNELVEISGKVTLCRNEEDTTHGFSFFSAVDSTKWENYYIQYTYYEVSSEIEMYKLNPNFGSSVLSTDAGQLIVSDLISLDLRSYSASTSSHKEYIELFFETKKGSSVIIKRIKIDNKSLLPFEIHCSRKEITQNLSYSTSWFLNDILVNEHVIDNELVELIFKSNYGHSQSAIPDKSYTLIGQKIPDIVFQTFRNEEINMRSLESDVVLLDFWEWWCGPCLNSLPKVNKIANLYKQYGLVTIGIASDDPDRAEKIIMNKKLNFEQVIGNAELKTLFDVTSFPRYILIDQKGIIRKIYRGYSEIIEIDINELLIK